MNTIAEALQKLKSNKKTKTISEEVGQGLSVPCEVGYYDYDGYSDRVYIVAKSGRYYAISEYTESVFKMDEAEYQDYKADMYDVKNTQLTFEQADRLISAQQCEEMFTELSKEEWFEDVFGVAPESDDDWYDEYEDESDDDASMSEDLEPVPEDDGDEEVVVKHIEIDCAPHDRRPDQILHRALEGTELEVPEPDYKSFGEWGFSFKVKQSDWDKLYDIIYDKLLEEYEAGNLRYAHVEE